jgi:hypothetical protein
VEDFLASVSGAGTMAEKLPVAEKLRKENAVRQKAGDAVLRNAVPGQFYKEQGGVFTGTYTPLDPKTGEKLGPTFNVYAALKDYTHQSSFVFTYNEVAARISRLKNWRGFDGENVTNDTEINKALIDGTYGGGWIVPTEGMLCGGFWGNSEHNVRVHKNDGLLQGSFTTEKPRLSAIAALDDYSDCYWSSSENGFDRNKVSGAVFADDSTATVTSEKDTLKFRCRPVRLVQVPDGGGA